MNTEGVGYVPDENDLSSTDPVDRSVMHNGRKYSSDIPSPTLANDISRWSNEISPYKVIPSHGPWDIIPSRAVMITNLPKTTQSWTLIELLKVSSLFILLKKGCW